MHVAMFCHSLRSDWNHGNAHFLRGVASELIARGHRIDVHEPLFGWSARNLLAQYGPHAMEAFRSAYPLLDSRAYELRTLDLDDVLDGVDLVLVHEWTEHELVRRIGEHRARNPHYRLLFHDTHHRALTDRRSIAAYDLRNYDGVLVFGAVLRELYLAKGWADAVWVWHEAADTRVFRPMQDRGCDSDLVWIGNWGDGERSAELMEFLVGPVRGLGLRCDAYGVRYPQEARSALARAGIRYRGWLPNHRVPAVFGCHAATVHVPRRPYAEALPGIPTIRPFEAMACGIPLVSAPWHDAEGLFTPGRDFLVARDGRQMTRHLRDLLRDEEMANELATHAHRTVLARHTCAHRVDELFDICREMAMPVGLHPGINAS